MISHGRIPLQPRPPCSNIIFTKLVVVPAGCAIYSWRKLTLQPPTARTQRQQYRHPLPPHLPAEPGNPVSCPAKSAQHGRASALLMTPSARSSCILMQISRCLVIASIPAILAIAFRVHSGAPGHNTTITLNIEITQRTQLTPQDRGVLPNPRFADALVKVFLNHLTQRSRLTVG